MNSPAGIRHQPALQLASAELEESFESEAQLQVQSAVARATTDTSRLGVESVIDAKPYPFIIEARQGGTDGARGRWSHCSRYAVLLWRFHRMRRLYGQARVEGKRFSEPNGERLCQPRRIRSTPAFDGGGETLDMVEHRC